MKPSKINPQSPKLKKIQCSANIGLYGSIILGILTLVYHNFCHYRFYVNPYGRRFMLVAASVLSVLTIVTLLLVVRRSIPRLRQMSSLEEKLAAYAKHISDIFRGSLAVVVFICVIIVLSNESIVFMLLMLIVLMLIMLYPSSMKLKVDLGLTDEELLTLLPRQDDQK